MCGLATRQGLGHEEFWALNDVSFTVRRGESIGLLGANGAGKSTLLKIIAGLIKPDRGHVTVRGRVGALIELGAGMHPLLSGRENIRVNAAVLGLSQRELASKLDEIIAFADLGEFIDAPVQSYSSGMRVRLGFAVAAHLEPDLLIVDEVLAVGDMPFRLKCYQRTLDLQANGTSIVLVSHHPIDLLRVTSEGLWLQSGRLLSSGHIYALLGEYTKALRRSHATGAITDSAASISDVILTPDTIPTQGQTECRIFITARKSIPLLRLLVHIESVDGEMLGSFSSSIKGYTPCIDTGKHLIRLKLLSLPLLSGDYFVHISLHGPKAGDLYDYWRHKSILHVDDIKPDPFGFGVYHSIHIEHEWLPPEAFSNSIYTSKGII
ncbi:MAG TPA: ABC transporter ATP-binding protein [Opitutaceae bacterium]|nr:ABC transporter ATP-binding protein [Opitutaceae bacterium]